MAGTGFERTDYLQVGVDCLPRRRCGLLPFAVHLGPLSTSMEYPPSFTDNEINMSSMSFTFLERSAANLLKGIAGF